MSKFLFHFVVLITCCWCGFALGKEEAFLRKTESRVEAGGEHFAVSFSGKGALTSWDTKGHAILRDDGVGAVWRLRGVSEPESLTYSLNPPLSWKWRSPRTMASWTVGVDEVGVILANNDLSPAVFSIPLDVKSLSHVRAIGGEWKKTSELDEAVEVDRIRWEFPDGEIGLWRGVGNFLRESGRGNCTLEIAVEAGEVTDWSWRIGEIPVISPQNHAVYQRSTRNEGSVRVEGVAPLGSVAVSIAVSGDSSRLGELPGRPVELAVDPESGEFSENVDLPAGGWYRMTITGRDGNGKVTGIASVEPFGVGEVFVVAGQSNSTNSGQTPTRQKSGLVATFSGSGWRAGDDPMPGTHDNAPRGSFQPSMGDVLAARFSVPIGIASTGQGASSIRHWQPDYESNFEEKTYCNGLHAWTLYRVRQLGIGGFRALLWHQGEGDASGGLSKNAEKVEEYSEALIRVLSAWRADAGWDFPAFTAQASVWPMANAKHGGDRYLREAQALVWKRGVAHAGPDTDQLGLEYRQDDSASRVHFNAAGLKAHGEIWAEILSRFIESELDG